MHKNIKEKYLIIGKDSNIGRCIENYLIEKNENVVGTSRRRNNECLYLNLEENKSKWEIPIDCTVVFICLGITSIDFCENNYKKAYNINVKQTIALIDVLIKKNIFIIFLSTNLVFDGNKSFELEYAIQNPKTNYGLFKTKVEEYILKNNKNAAIVRLTKVLEKDNILINDWIKNLKINKVIKPFKNMFLAPISMELVLNSLYKIANLKKRDIYHLSGDRDISYADLANFIAELYKLDKNLIEPIQANKSIILRPKNTTLNMDVKNNVYDTIINIFKGEK